MYQSLLSCTEVLYCLSFADQGYVPQKANSNSTFIARELKEEISLGGI